MPRLAPVLLVALAVVGCKKRSPPSDVPAERTIAPPAAAASADAGDGSHVLDGDLTIGSRPIRIVVFLPKPAPATLVVDVAGRVRRRFPGIDVSTSLPTRVLSPAALVYSPPADDFEPPDEDDLRFGGRGLTDKQRTAAAASKGSLLLTFALDDDPRHAHLRDAEALALDVATKRGGFLWDGVTRNVYAPAAWKEARVDGWDGDVPDVVGHVTIQYYEKEDGSHRAITLGMAKLGLPDLVMSDVPPSERRAASTLIDAVAQALVEGARLTRGELALDVTTLRHRAARDAYLSPERAGPHAIHRGRVTLTPTASEQGDPDNRLVALTFPSYPGPTEGERQAAALGAIMGAEDDVPVPHERRAAELDAVKERVQARLPAVAEAFRKRLPVGERIIVKAPFATDDGGKEWMWIGVTEWNGLLVRGTLENEPSLIASLHLGAKVEAKQATIADYVWYDADGATKEGGESIAVLKERDR